MGKDYLVNGAKLICICGSKIGKLKIPKGHGYTSKKKKKANCKDCIAYKNISDFGECSQNKLTHLCKGFMKLEDKWVSTSLSGILLEKLAGKKTITMDSILLCKRGGLIIPLTSGQGYEKGINWRAFLKRFQKALCWLLGKNLLCHIFGEDPINLNSGNYIYEKEDLNINGMTPLSFKILYNSMEHGTDGCLGEGWHHNYEIYVREEAEGKVICVCMGDGKVLPYRRSVGDICVPVFGDRGVLKSEGETYNYRTPEGIKYLFDDAGKLVAREYKNGNRDTFSYDGKGRLIQVTGNNGGEFFYSYNAEGKLICVRDHTGREVCLRYRYGKLYQFVNSCGYVYTYTYNEDGKLESVITPREIVGVKNTYDSVGRVTRQEMPDGSVVELMYDDENNRTYDKQRNGNMVIYESDELFRNVKTIYEDGEEIYEYNDQNLVTLFIDKNGNKTSYSYDEKGNLTGIKDALGRQRSFTYDENGQLLTESVEGRKIRTNIYNEKGLLVKTEDALGRSRKILYNEKEQPEQIILPDESCLNISYDEKGNILAVRDSYGNTIRYVYDALNRVEEMVDNEGNKIRYNYDERNHLLTVTNPLGDSRNFAYNASGKLTRITDFDGGIQKIEYNVMGKPEQLTDKEGRKLKWEYDSMGNLEQVIFPTGATALYRYDKNNRIVRVERKKDAETEVPETVYTYNYDAVGNLVYVSAGDGKKIYSEVFYEYDALNRLAAVTNSAGAKTCYTYDWITGKINSITDPAGNQRTYRYNDAGELTEQTDIRGNVIRYEYNVLAKLCTVIDGAGRVLKRVYQPGGRLEKMIYPTGREITYGYDNLGRISSKTYQNGYSVMYSYDEMGRVIQVSSSEGQKKSCTYDALGHVTSITDAMENTTGYMYTLNGLMKEVVDALGNHTEYAYDATGSLSRICQHGKNGEEDRVTEYMRNAFGQVECVRDVLGMEETYLYDALGRIIEKTDREGYRTSYAYTADGRIESIRYGDGSQAEFIYTPLGQLSMIRDWLGETKIERDCYGKPERITDHNGQTVGYEWGQFGERKGMIYPNGTKVQWKYDKFLRPIEFTRVKAENGNSGKFAGSGNQIRISYQYNKEGRLTDRKSSGGYHTIWGYDERGRLETLTHKYQETILESYRYGYDAMGDKIYVRKDRSGLPKESGTFQYYYDALRRLIEVEKDGKILHSYSYDSFGNRIEFKDYEYGEERRYHYNNLNYLIEENWRKADSQNVIVNKTYRYDLRGNLVEEHRDGELFHTYKFNATNRMERAVLADGSTASYMYNGTGQRVWRESSGEKEEYLLDLTKPYNNLIGMERRESQQYFYWDFRVVAMDETGRPSSYYLNDEKGSPLRLLYDNGNGCTYGYDEFGKELYVEQDSDSQEKRREQPFSYLGYRYDDVSGTYFVQAREYRCDSGRFISKDKEKFATVGDPLSHNLFSAYRNSPLNYIDDSGNEILVISGGNNDDSKFDYQFIETALTNINEEIDSGTPSEDITWIVFDAGYDESQMENFRQTADNLDINFEEVNDKEEFISYINYKDKHDNDGGIKRAEDQITSVTVFSHGESSAYSNVEENQLSFAYGIEALEARVDQINFTQSDIARLHEDAFRRAFTIFYSCNAGTDDSNGQSFAQAWSNMTGGVSLGVKNGRTYYGCINTAASSAFKIPFIGANSLEDAWNLFWNTDLGKEKKNRKKDRAKRGYSEMGSLNYPCLAALCDDLDILLRGGFDRGWEYFFPESGCPLD